ncbi:MAG: hypothetical protein Q7S30_05650, partial [Candidatus Omnitrophota bacterium]|nr:hypothetical protein [Candidatus Omnitrophota bacterium]
MPRDKEVTNYDMLSYDKKNSVAKELLPTNQEAEQAQAFSPGYVQEQQSKHEAIIRQKQDGEDLLWTLDQGLKRKLKKDDEEIELKHKRGGGSEGGRQGRGIPLGYTLADYDEEGNPQQLNVYNYNSDGSLKSIVSYDIKGLDASRWTAQEMTDKDGKKFFGSYDKADTSGLTEGRIMDEVIYTGASGSETIDYILSDFGDDGKPGTVSVYEYNKNADGNDNLDEVKTYNVDGEEIDLTKSKSEWIGLLTDDKLSKTTVYQFDKGKEQVNYVLDNYSVNTDGKNSPGRMSVYDYNNNTATDANNETLDEVRSYDISAYYGSANWDTVLGELLSDNSAILETRKGDLESVSLFSGSKGSEVISQTFYYEDSAIIQRKDYSYFEYDAKYSDTKKKALRSILTYNTDNADLTPEQRKTAGAGELVSEDLFTGAAGHEQVSQSFTYTDNQITVRKDYEYVNGALAHVYSFDVSGVSGVDAADTEQKKREKSTIVYNADGSIKFTSDESGPGSVFTGELDEESIFTGVPGKEKIDQTFSYAGGKLVERTDYIYENGRLVDSFKFDTSSLTGD